MGEKREKSQNAGTEQARESIPPIVELMDPERYVKDDKYRERLDRDIKMELLFYLETIDELIDIINNEDIGLRPGQIVEIKQKFLEELLQMAPNRYLGLKKHQAASIIENDISLAEEDQEKMPGLVQEVENYEPADFEELEGADTDEKERLKHLERLHVALGAKMINLPNFIKSPLYRAILRTKNESFRGMAQNIRFKVIEKIIELAPEIELKSAQAEALIKLADDNYEEALAAAARKAGLEFEIGGAGEKKERAPTGWRGAEKAEKIQAEYDKLAKRLMDGEIDILRFGAEVRKLTKNTERPLAWNKFDELKRIYEAGGLDEEAYKEAVRLTLEEEAGEESRGGKKSTVQ